MDDWKAYREHLWIAKDSKYLVDYSLLLGGASELSSSEGLFAQAVADMKALEAGELVNSDEGRMVGHYWLRAPKLAPNDELKTLIEDEVAHVRSFTEKVHAGEISPPKGGVFKYVLSVGIGGSALGPQLLSEAFRTPDQPLEFFSLDNTDPDGAALVLSLIPNLSETLVLVVSKSGGTKETRNGMLLVEEAYRSAGLSFAQHAVAITGEGSLLDEHAKKEGWIERFPMWDWVGGRTSLWCSVGLLPAALIGIDIEALLEGAKEMDELTRVEALRENPAAIVAHSWFQFSKSKDMVVLPYKDRLLLLSRYLQQLVMESVGKQLDRAGNTVEEGLSVYGNKGSTDQHAYVQQLRDGRNNFFALFVEVLNDFASLKKSGAKLDALQDQVSLEVEDGVTAGDYLQGFYLGTREALAENGRSSLTITIPEVSAHSLGALIALFERAVSFYASFVNINAYHQPGVEAGKKAAERVLELQRSIVSQLKSAGDSLTVDEIASRLDSNQHVHIFKILERLSAVGVATKSAGVTQLDARYGLS